MIHPTQMRPIPSLNSIHIKSSSRKSEYLLYIDNTMADLNWQQRKPDDYSARRWRIWLEERYSLRNHKLGSPLYQFLADEVRIGRPGIALGDFLSKSESVRRKKEYPNILHYWTGKENPWYPAYDSTLSVLQSQTHLAPTEVPTMSNCLKRKQHFDGPQISAKRLKAVKEEIKLNELTARNTRLNSARYLTSTHIEIVPVARPQGAHDKVSTPDESEERRCDNNPISDNTGPSLMRSLIMAGEGTTEQSTRKLRSAIKRTSGNVPSMIRQSKSIIHTDQ